MGICNKNFAVLVALAMTATFGIVMFFVGCAIRIDKDFINWWGIFVILFYVVSPLPLILSKCCTIKESAPPESLSLLSDICYFVSSFIVVSAFALPLILARQKIIEYSAFGLIGGANIFVFATVFTFVLYFIRDEDIEWGNSGF